MTTTTTTEDRTTIASMLMLALPAISGTQTERETAERLYELRGKQGAAFDRLFAWMEQVMPLVEIRHRSRDGWLHFDSLYAGHLWLKSNHLTSDELKLLVGLADVDELERPTATHAAAGGAQ